MVVDDEIIVKNYDETSFIFFLALSAILLNLIFKEEVWWRHLCPLPCPWNLRSILMDEERRKGEI